MTPKLACFGRHRQLLGQSCHWLIGSLAHWSVSGGNMVISHSIGREVSTKDVAIHPFVEIVAKVSKLTRRLKVADLGVS